MYGNDYRYAATRLDDTITRTKDGNPVYIQHVEADGSVSCIDIDHLYTDDGNKVLRLEELNLEPVPLGYMNGKLGCTYLSRMPVRKWKQGLRLTENCFSSAGHLGNMDYVALAKTIRGEYPAYKTVIQRGKGSNNPFAGRGNGLMAWHRFWATDKKKVFYRTEYVGDLVDGLVKLFPSFKYLQESLEESL